MNLLKTKIFLILKQYIDNQENFLLIKHDIKKNYFRKDIDFLVNQNYDIASFLEKNNFDYNLKITEKENGYHLDYYIFSLFIFRLDLVMKLKKNKLFDFNSNFYIEIFDNKKIDKTTKDIFFENYCLPDINFEVLIRLSELINNPEKIHHREYLKNNYSVLQTVEYNKYLEIYNLENLIEFIKNI